MKLGKKIAAVVLAFSMMLSMAACADTAWVFSYGDKTVSSGLYLSFLMSAYSEAGTKVADAEADLFSQKVEEKPAKEWIVEKAQVLASQYIAVENKFEEMGLSLTESDENQIAQSMKTEWPQVSKIYEQNGVAESTYKLYVTNRRKTSKLFEKYYAEDGGVEPITNDSLMVHYKENFARVNVLGITKGMAFDDEGKDDIDKANEELLEMANGYAKSINDKEKTFGEVYHEYAHYNEQTEHDDEDSTDVVAKDEDTIRLIKKDADTLGEELSKAIFEDMKPDSKALVTSDDKAYYVIVRYELENTTDSEFEEMRASILADLKQDEFIKIAEGWGVELKPSETNSAAVRRYNPKKIKMV